jgi:hypothetical protein
MAGCWLAEPPIAEPASTNVKDDANHGMAGENALLDAGDLA